MCDVDVEAFAISICTTTVQHPSTPADPSVSVKRDRTGYCVQTKDKVAGCGCGGRGGGRGRGPHLCGMTISLVLPSPVSTHTNSVNPFRLHLALLTQLATATLAVYTDNDQASSIKVKVEERAREVVACALPSLPLWALP